VKPHQFRPGEYVLRSNEASHVIPPGKLSPKWEGPYQVKEALGKGSYTLIRLDGKEEPGT
jgi:hypothetical protein